jgi:hypothetical protein
MGTNECRDSKWEKRGQPSLNQFIFSFFKKNIPFHTKNILTNNFRRVIKQVI